MILWLHPPILSVMARAIPHPMPDRLSFVMTVVMTSWIGVAGSERIDPWIDPRIDPRIHSWMSFGIPAWIDRPAASRSALEALQRA